MIKFLRNVFGIIALFISASFAVAATGALFKISRYGLWAVFGFGFNFLFAYLLFKLGDKLTTFEVPLFKKIKNE